MASRSMSLTIYDLPNEILVSILSSFHTHSLLSLTLISHRFHNLILRILHFRLLLAASAPEYKIILEAYLPSRRYTRPYLYCTYLGTDGLSSEIEGKGSLYRDLDDKIGGRLGKLGGLYSRFRPEFPDVEGNMPIRRIAGAAPNLQSNTSGLNLDWYSAPGYDANAGVAVTESPTPAIAGSPSTDTGTATAGADLTSSGEGSSDTHEDNEQAQAGTHQGQSQPQPQPDQPLQLPQTQPVWANKGDGGSRRVVYTLNIDADELFTQFCAAATLVQLGPRRGVFLSYIPIVKDKHGVIRVWKHWLLERARLLIDAELGNSSGTELKRTPTDLRSEDILKDKNVLWTDYRKNVGLRLAIREKAIAGLPVRELDEDKDDIPLRFDLEIRELIVRTTHLMLAVEDSQNMQNQPGKALIFGNFAVPAG